MRRRAVCSAVVSLLWVALPVAAQDDGGSIAAIHCFEVQPGSEADFEAGWKKHTDWHRKQKDSWTWVAWQVTTGPDTGRYCAGTFGHNWEDFDSPGVPEEADLADMAATFVPFVREHKATFWARMPEVSRPGEGPVAMSAVVFFHTRFGTADKFNYLAGEFQKAIEKTEKWNYNWHALVSGGEGGTYALVLPRSNFAAFKPGKPFAQVLREAYGQARADALLAEWRTVVTGSESHITRSRPDLGYVPEGQ